MRGKIPVSGRKMIAGVPRFFLYSCLQVCIFLLPFFWLAALGVFIAFAGFLERIKWLSWLRRSWPVLIMAALPAIFGFPFSGNGDILLVWLPYLRRSAQFLLIFTSAAWLSHGMSPIDLRGVLLVLLRPFGRGVAADISLAGSLMLAFMPWTRDEILKAHEAALVRGSDPARKAARHIYAIGIPVCVRTLEKARHSAEALLLRDHTYDGFSGEDNDAAFTDTQSAARHPAGRQHAAYGQAGGDHSV